MDSIHEWAPGFSCDIDKMTSNKHNSILISLALYPLDTLKDVEIVTSLESGSKQIAWGSTRVSEFITPGTMRQWVKAYHVIQLEESYSKYPNMKIKVYIWNRGRKKFYMDDFTVRAIEGNPIAYGLIDKI
jgi:hypothetical protein